MIVKIIVGTPFVNHELRVGHANACRISSLFDVSRLELWSDELVKYINVIGWVIYLVLVVYKIETDESIRFLKKLSALLRDVFPNY